MLGKLVRVYGTEAVADIGLRTLGFPASWVTHGSEVVRIGAALVKEYGPRPAAK